MLRFLLYCMMKKTWSDCSKSFVFQTDSGLPIIVIIRLYKTIVNQYQLVVHRPVGFFQGASNGRVFELIDRAQAIVRAREAGLGKRNP